MQTDNIFVKRIVVWAAIVAFVLFLGRTAYQDIHAHDLPSCDHDRAMVGTLSIDSSGNPYILGPSAIIVASRPDCWPAAEVQAAHDYLVSEGLVQP